MEDSVLLMLVFLTGALLESVQNGRNPRLRVAILYFSSIIFSVMVVSFQFEKEIDGASAGVFGLVGGHIGMYFQNLFLSAS